MAIESSDLGITDMDLARRVIVYARTTIAPCLDQLSATAREDAIAVLKGVALEAQARGPRSVVNQKVGTASVSYGPASSWFTDDDRAALRALCELAQAGDASHPTGRFPLPPMAYKALWPEEVES